MARHRTYADRLAAHIAAVVAARGIEDVLHFTPRDNLPGILEHGLLGRTALAGAAHGFRPSDASRLDGRDEAISVSVSCYYPKMFRAKRDRARRVPWIILVLDPRLLWTRHCLFYRRGATTRITQQDLRKRYGGFAFERLFADCSSGLDARGSGFRAAHDLPPDWPTFPDSEVQVLEPVPPELILGAWVETARDREWVEALFARFGRDDCGIVQQPFEPRIVRRPYAWG